MRRLLRVFVILAVAAAVLFTSTGVALAAAVVHSGVVTVAIDDRSPDGVSLYIPVPALLVNVGASTLPLWMPAEELAEVRRELAPYRDSLRGLARALEEMPDATLVQVRSDREQVDVIKSGRNLRIVVKAEDANVRVSLPVASFGRLLDAIT